MASAKDIIFIAVILFTFAIGFFIVHYAANTMVTEMLAYEEINESEATVEAMGGVASVTARLDYVIFGVFMALILALIVAGYFVGGVPLFMFIYFIVIVLTVVISAVLSNVWETITTTTALSGSLSAFPITNHLMLNLPLYMSIIGFIGLIAMFAKPLSQGGGGEQY